MKSRYKISIICVFSLFTLSILTPMGLSTTIGDTTFPAEIGKRYIWEFTYPSESKGEQYYFTTESITQGLHMTHESLIVMATMEVYSPRIGWFLLENNSLYLAANETEDYLYFDNDSFYHPFVIPTPINLPLVAEAVAMALFIFNYSIDGNTIKFNGMYTSYEYTFNSGGFLTTIIINNDVGRMWRIVLLGGGNKIPFGIYFLISAVSSIAVIAIYIKKGQLRIK